mgnify:CR=1 FL=1
MKKLILIIDDDADDREIIEINFRKAGYENIIFSKNGEEGVESAKQNKPAVVVTDTNLPGIDGFSVCKKIKEIDNGRIKVIVMTGYVDAVDAVKAHEMGADEYAVKTQDMPELVKALKSLLD